MHMARRVTRETSLAAKRPDLLAEWDWEQNITDPWAVGVGYGTPVHWQHEVDGVVHHWITSPANRTRSKPTGCSVCSNKQVQAGVNCLETTDSYLLAEWDYTRNEIDPSEVGAGSEKLVYWHHFVDGVEHSWRTMVKTRAVQGSGCKTCAGHEVLEDFNDFASVYPEAAVLWDHERNEGLLPSEVMPNSERQVWFRCAAAGHSWKTSVRTVANDRGCPECSETGFSPEKPGWLYLIRHPENGWLQAGISNVPENRLASHARRGWEYVDLRGPMSGHLALELEQEVFRALRRRGVPMGTDAGLPRFNGYTEAWAEKALPVQTVAGLLSLVYADEAD